MSIFDDMDNLAQVQAHLAHWRDQLADGRREDDFLFVRQAKGIIATLEHKEAELQVAQSAPAPKVVRPNEFWWANLHNHDHVEVVEVQFEDGKPHWVYVTGTDVGIAAYEFDRCEVRLIERVLPAGRAAAAVKRLEEIAGEKWPWRVVEEVSAILQDGENRA
ncbi:hypothetical protein NS228_04980 [Methylobacterium indicum]|uniref:hypothetical protein n=1 Tax=Methylobacterium indicum TaxID=1775910 RepID=UPI000734EB98|nr:hypothetical protein [Methylobacterium indicum]KTS39512.1 hypothetical protein NS229_00085 [Methylobacterium indicum]KTS41740.1 hypothetical protein NS228_04980 [Methylobacterium indicum]KTS53522.1 hypothetical protein NS230_05475 [Methylobacterium indicum]